MGLGETPQEVQPRISGPSWNLASPLRTGEVERSRTSLARMHTVRPPQVCARAQTRLAFWHIQGCAVDRVERLRRRWHRIVAQVIPTDLRVLTRKGVPPLRPPR
jgi:hypothetical protein